MMWRVARTVRFELTAGSHVASPSGHVINYELMLT